MFAIEMVSIRRLCTLFFGFPSLILISLPLPRTLLAQADANAKQNRPILVDLGTLPGFSRSQARAINNRGEVAGVLIMGTDEGDHAFLHRKDTLMDLGTLPSGSFSDAHGINDRGQVVGEAGWSTHDPFYQHSIHAFLWDKGVMRDLGTVGNSFLSRAFAINNRGQVVGFSGQPFLYENGVMKGLGLLPGATSGTAYSINEWGTIVGECDYPDGTAHAFRYRQGVMKDLGTLPGGQSTVARSINDLGQIVGTVTMMDGSTHGFLYQSGRMIDLNTLPGIDTSGSDAIWITDLGQILGSSYLYEFGRVISLYDAGNPNAGPNDPHFVMAASVNLSGQVAGVALPSLHAAILHTAPLLLRDRYEDDW